MSIYFPEDTQLASRYIKQAIPLMIKNKITPNPCNFALWYAYVANRDLELKNILNQMLEEKNEFPEEVCRDLFKKYIMKDEIDLQSNLQVSLMACLHELTGSIEKTKNKTDECQSSLEKRLESIPNSSDNSTLENSTKLLMQVTQSIKSVTTILQSQLESSKNEIEELRQMLHKKEQLTFIDPLTQIGNRRAFDTRIIKLNQKEKVDVTLVIIDLDYFKKLNDTYGHLMGDKVLKNVSKIIQQTCPENTLVARYGGEEFVILLEDSQEIACQVAEEIRVLLNKIRIKKKSSGEIIGNITASFGIAKKVEGEFPEQLIERADQALYKAKESGRDRIEIAI